MRFNHKNLFEIFLKCFCPLSDIKRERQPPSPDDVIVLSDNEPSSPIMNGHCFTKTDTDKLMVGQLNFAELEEQMQNATQPIVQST